MNKQLLTLSLFLTIISSSYAEISDYRPYVLKAGDNVSEIIAAHNLAPLYGENEWVDKVLKLNRLTLASAKKMEPGDVIVLPLRTKVFEQKQYEDEIQTMKSALKKEVAAQTRADIEANFLKDKNYNFTVGAEYFNQSVQFESDSVEIQQNFTGYIEYQEKNMNKTQGISIEPKIRLGFYTQSQADFESSETLNADFTPSYFGNLSLELRAVTYDFSLSPLVEYEQFSALRLSGGDFEVVDNELLWSGVEAAKYFRTNTNTFYLKSQLAVANDLDARRFLNRAGVLYKKHYQFELNANNREIELGETATVQSYGFNFGYLF